MTTPASDFLDSVARLRQDPQAVARASAKAGDRVVGYVGDDIPVALILAAGALPVRLRGVPGAGTERVDAFVESSFSPALRAVAAQWLEGSLDHLDAVIFTRGDDSAQRLYYYLCELQRRGICRGPRPLLFDVASLERQSSSEHTLGSTRVLATDLGTAGNRLEPALLRVARRTELLNSVRTRRALPSPLRSSVAWTVEYAAGCDWRDEFDERAQRWLNEAAVLDTPARVLLAGDPVPDEQLHLAVESAGGSIVLELRGASPGSPFGRKDSLDAIADEFRRRESPAMAMRNNPNWLADCAREQRADAVIVWASEEDEALPWEIPRQMQSLRAAGVPALLLTRQSVQLSAQATEQVMQFVSKLRGSR